MIWDVVRDGRIASNGRHQLQSEHIQGEDRQKGRGKDSKFKSYYLHHLHELEGETFLSRRVSM